MKKLGRHIFLVAMLLFLGGVSAIAQATVSKKDVVKTAETNYVTISQTAIPLSSYTQSAKHIIIDSKSGTVIENDLQKVSDTNVVFQQQTLIPLNEYNSTTVKKIIIDSAVVKKPEPVKMIYESKTAVRIH